MGFREIRFAWRSLTQQRQFTSVTVLMLALGIGATTAVFSIFYAALLQPLPYQNPDRVAVIWGLLQSAGTARAPVSGVMLSEIQHRNRAFSGIAGIWTISRTFLGENPEQVKAAKVTANFFDVLGVRALRGHTFEKSDDGGPAIVLTNGLFQRRFSSNTALLGKGLPLQGDTNTLVGVLPASFELHFAPDANVPADVQVFDTFERYAYGIRDQYFIRVIGRLKPGVSFVAAQADLNRVAAEIRTEYADYNRERLQFAVTGMQADAVRDVKPALTALFAGAALVLTICCVNVMGLLAARGSGRRKEMALRLALGASRLRILWQLLAEGGLLCILGGAVGIAFGWAGLRGLLAIRPERLARIGDAGSIGPVLSLAASLSFSAALLCGLAPAVESFRMDLMATLRAGGRSWLSGLHRKTGNALVVGEITLAFILVTGAALMARTLSHLEQVRPGFEPHNLLAFQIGGWQNPAAVTVWERKLRTLPGVDRVGGTSHLPLDTDIPNWYSPFQPEGVAAKPGATFISDLRCITPGYLLAMGVRLITGRYFDEHDRLDGQQVVIVDELLARSTWPGQSAIGKRIEAEHVTENGFQPVSSVVVGVVEHVYNHSLTKQVRGEIYMPYEQSPRSPLTFVLRTQQPPLSLVPAVRRTLRDQNKQAAMAKVRVMTEYVAREIAPSSFTAVLSAIFAMLALLLAITGIYGVLSYQVSQRMAEIGIRMALGATGRQVIRLFLGESFVLAITGVMLGAIGAWFTARLLTAFLYGISPSDPISFSLALLLVPAAVLAGSLIPASRAAKSNPSEIIRGE